MIEKRIQEDQKQKSEVKLSKVQSMASGLDESSLLGASQLNISALPEDLLVVKGPLIKKNWYSKL